MLIAMLIFVGGAGGGPAILQGFDTIAACEQARPVIQQGYQAAPYGTMRTSMAGKLSASDGTSGRADPVIEALRAAVASETRTKPRKGDLQRWMRKRQAEIAELRAAGMSWHQFAEVLAQQGVLNDVGRPVSAKSAARAWAIIHKGYFNPDPAGACTEMTDDERSLLLFCAKALRRQAA